LTAESLFGDIDLGSRPDIALPAPPPAADDDADAVAADCCDLLERRDFQAAQERLAEALRQDPRNRALRALYHVASGRLLLDRGDAVQATAQFEAALAHDRDCEQAQRALDEVRKAHDKRAGLFRRLFK
jgi:Tfp pilus assembly protein PilF